MKTRFDIGDNELENILSKVWAINATKICFLPVGEDNWVYIIEDRDGKKVLDKKRNLRNDKQYGINQVMFSLFFGGDDETWHTKKDEKVYFRRFEVKGK